MKLTKKNWSASIEVVPKETIKVITLYISLSSACLSYQGELLTLYRQIGDNSQRI